MERPFFVDAMLFRLCYFKVHLRLPSVCIRKQ